MRSNILNVIVIIIGLSALIGSILYYIIWPIQHLYH